MRIRRLPPRLTPLRGFPRPSGPSPKPPPHIRGPLLPPNSVLCHVPPHCLQSHVVRLQFHQALSPLRDSRKPFLYLECSSSHSSLPS